MVIDQEDEDDEPEEPYETGSRLRNFVFTSYKCSEVQKAHLLAMNVGFLVFQLEECPTTRRAHYQGYCELKKQLAFASVKRLLGDPGVHLAKRRGTAEQARDYCKKRKTRVSGPWSIGAISSPGKRLLWLQNGPSAHFE